MNHFFVSSLTTLVSLVIIFVLLVNYYSERINANTDESSILAPQPPRRLLNATDNTSFWSEFYAHWNVPVPGEPYEYIYQNRTQNMTLNPNVTYFRPDTTMECNIEFDEDGKLDSDVSYIQILDDLFSLVAVDKVLVAGGALFDHLPINCTLVPAVMITDIINDTTNGILTLHIREADMFEYIDEVDCNITNATLIDTGIDVGEIQRVKNLANYFSNASTIVHANGTTSNITFTNITYTELEAVCYNVSENGTILHEIPMINGLCDELSVVDYFGQSKGIDAVNFGNITFQGNDSLFGVEPLEDLNDNDENEDPIRRRLFGKRFRRFRRRFVNRIKKVVKKVANFVTDIIDILRGDINKRLFEISLDINAGTSYSISGTEEFVEDDSDVSITASGTFDIGAGVEFHSSIHADLVAKYKIFSRNPSFDLFRLSLGGETHFKAYIDVHLDGTVDIKYEIGRIDKRKIFMLGPIPIVIRPYASFSVGIASDSYLDFMMEFGYLPASFEYGIEWNKQDNDWKTIEKPLVFEPFKNFASDANEDENCLQFTVAPYVEVKLGIVFYEIVDVHIIPTLILLSQFEYPSTCDSTDQCAHSPYLANFGMEFQFKIFIGLEVGILAPEAEDIFKGINLPTFSATFELPFNIPPVPLFDVCFPAPLLEFVGDACCASDNNGLPAPPQEDDDSVIYNHEMSSINGWTVDEGSVDIMLDSEVCPAESVSDNCWQLEASTEVYTSIATTGYEDIQILIDVNSVGNDILCWVEWWVDGMDGDHQEIAQNEAGHNIIGNGPFLDSTIILNGNQYNDAPAVNILLGAAGSSNNYCYFDNLRVIGHKN